MDRNEKINIEELEKLVKDMPTLGDPRQKALLSGSTDSKIKSKRGYSGGANKTRKGKNKKGKKTRRNKKSLKKINKKRKTKKSRKINK